MKQAGLALPDTKKTAPENWKESFVIPGHLVAALRGQEEFRIGDHSTYLQEGISNVRKRSVLWEEEGLAETLTGPLVQDPHQLRRATNMGEWLTVQPSRVNGT